MSWFSKLSKPMPFLNAVMAGKVGDVRKHLEAGVDPNQVVDGDTYPLHYAVHTGAEIVDLLIQHGADVNTRSRRGGGKTALHLAAGGAYLDVITLLVKAGADINATDSYGHTPMFDAAAAVSAYDMIYVNTGGAPSEGAMRERSGRGAVVALLKSRGAVPSRADAETAKAIGSVPEAERHNRHMTLAYNQGDFEYHRAVGEISMEYPFLYDAFRLLRNKTSLSGTEKVFVDRFESYERMMR
jgi:hypothetical protein